jgi:hypothetical protein
MCAALADADAIPDPQERCDTALQFARIQATFIFDDIAKAEATKMDVATVNLGIFPPDCPQSSHVERCMWVRCCRNETSS